MVPTCHFIQAGIVMTIHDLVFFFQQQRGSWKSKVKLKVIEIETDRQTEREDSCCLLNGGMGVLHDTTGMVYHGRHGCIDDGEVVNIDDEQDWAQNTALENSNFH